MAGRYRLVALLVSLAIGFGGPLAGFSGPTAWAAEQSKTKPDVAAEKPATDAAKQADLEYYELYKILADTMYQVEQNYVTKVDRRELMEAAIRGVLDKLDPYSNYISPDELGRFKTSVENQFGGIGIQITMDGGQLHVLSPIVGSPAYRAGLQSGDAILEIEGKSTEGITLDDAVRRLKGEAGTRVNITVQHARGGKQEKLSINREIVQLETVLGDRRKPDDSWDFMLDHDKKIGYIRLTAFSRETASDLEKALEELTKEHMKGLILDLRFNPGGLLKSATDIADLFVTDGVIVSTEGRNTPRRVVTAKKPGTFEGFPMVVLVNRYSASASEIVSACLQDHHRAVIIGERTWGKGSVQNVIDLEEGRSALKLTTARYLRPNGHNIHRLKDAKESDEWGVMPDKGYDLKLPDQELGQLIRFRRDRDIVSVQNPQDKDKTAKSDKPDASDKTAAGDKPATTSNSAGDATKSDAPTGPDAKKPDDKAEDKKPEDKKPDDKKSDDKTPDEKSKDKSKAADKKPAGAKSVFVDRQLQKALDYLDSELAKS
jgi:carboxyl-terminal processing protease